MLLAGDAAERQEVTGRARATGKLNQSFGAVSVNVCISRGAPHITSGRGRVAMLKRQYLRTGPLGRNVLGVRAMVPD